MVWEGTTAQRTSRRPGRPRSTVADSAILATALRLLIDQGYAGLSLEAVAAGAGVGKTTIYRRYRDKRELAAAAVATMIEHLGPMPDSGDTRTDIIALIERQQQALSAGALFSMVGTLLVEERRNPELLEEFRRRVIRPNRARVRELLERGIRRGEIRPDADVEAAVDVLAGAIFARHLDVGGPSPGWAEAIIALVWRGLAAADHPAT